YPSTFSPDESVATWAKCPFYCTKYNEEIFNEHLTKNAVKNVIVYTVPQTYVLMSGDV
ncbi:29907_t:CDS:2, partial [Racocetra persica]